MHFYLNRVNATTAVCENFSWHLRLLRYIQNTHRQIDRLTTFVAKVFEPVKDLDFLIMWTK